MTTNEEIGLRIKTRREELGMTQEELGKRLFLNKSTIQRYETGKIQKIKIPFLHAVSKALNVDPDYLALRTEKKGVFNAHWDWYKINNGNYSVDDGVLPIGEQEHKLIPVLGSVPAGIPIEAIQDIIDYEEISDEMARGGEYFALRVKGASMEPRIREGDIVIIRKQEEIANGEIAVVMVNGNDATIKKFYKDENG